ncbi:MAG: hypothetical protein EAZ08_02765 [Cytophagales bacterium]|nr:MAG: hypothetical protein EAZ08_02765 [Cytophagales bacterium]
MEKLDNEQKYFRSILNMVLDGEGDRQEVNFCMNKIAHCTYCRTQFEQENAVRDCIKKYNPYMPPPQDLLPSISQLISQQSAIYV